MLAGSFFGEKHQCYFCSNHTQLVCTKCQDICCAECLTESGFCPLCVRKAIFRSEQALRQWYGDDVELSVQLSPCLVAPFEPYDWHDAPTEHDLPSGFTTVLAEV